MDIFRWRGQSSAPLVDKGRFRTGRFAIPYRCYGRAGATVVCVNGALQTMAVWLAAVKRFGPEFRFLLFDSPGMARNGITSGSREVTMEEQVDALRALVEQRVSRDAPVCLVGASWGALVAAMYAARHPEDMDGMILGSFSLKPSPRLMAIMEEACGLYARDRQHKGARLIIDAFGQRLPPSFKRRIAHQIEMLSPGQFESFRHHLQTLVEAGPLTDYVDLGGIRARTLVINGQEDDLWTDEDLQTIRCVMPRARIELVPGAGHFLHLEDERIYARYAAFLHEVARGLAPASANPGLTARLALLPEANAG